MTRNTNARLAGFMFLFYIATAFPLLVLSDRVMGGSDVAAKLANIAQHVPLMRVLIVLNLSTFLSALLLAVSLYGITRDEDHELAVLALSCRIAEGVINAISTAVPLGLLWIATDDSRASIAVAAFLLKSGDWTMNISATCFAVGSTIFAYLLLRGRIIPVWLAWLGVAGSALLVVAIPMQLVDVLHAPVTDLMYLPVAAFEVIAGFWLLFKGCGGAAATAP